MSLVWIIRNNLSSNRCKYLYTISVNYKWLLLIYGTLVENFLIFQTACKDKYPQKIKQKALSDILKSQALSASSKTCYN